MSNRWKGVWEKKDIDSLDLEQSEFEIFCKLKKADGFDVNVHDEKAYFMAFYQEWLDMYEKGKELAQNEISSVYEVGCGSGVNLFLFQNRIDNPILGGIDYSQNLINIAQNIVHSTDLVCGEAVQINEEEKYDWVMADSVFQYFENINYAETVLEKMIHKSRKVTYLSEIHDVTLKDEWLEYRRSSMENYDQIYEGLDKTFYSKEWITDIARRNYKKVIFSKGNNPEYWNSKYVFHCFIL